MFFRTLMLVTLCQVCCVHGLCEISGCLSELDAIYNDPQNRPASITDPCNQQSEIETLITDCVEENTDSCVNALKKIYTESVVPTTLKEFYNQSCWTPPNIPVDPCVTQAELTRDCLLNSFLTEHFNLSLSGGQLENELHSRIDNYLYNETTMCRFASELNLDNFIGCSYEFLENCSNVMEFLLPLDDAEAAGEFSSAMLPHNAVEMTHVLKGLCNRDCDESVGEQALMLDDCIVNFILAQSQENTTVRIDPDNVDGHRCMLLHETWSCLIMHADQCPLLVEQVNRWLAGEQGLLQDLTSCDDYITGGGEPEDHHTQPPIGKGNSIGTPLWIVLLAGLVTWM